MVVENIDELNEFRYLKDKLGHRKAIYELKLQREEEWKLVKKNKNILRRRSNRLKVKKNEKKNLLV